MNFTWDKLSPCWTPLTCPFLIIFIASIPLNVLLVVLQKPANGKAGRTTLSFLLPHVYCFPIQVAALLARNHPAERSLVLSLFAQLPRFGGDDAGAGGGGGSLNH